MQNKTQNSKNQYKIVTWEYGTDMKKFAKTMMNDLKNNLIKRICIHPYDIYNLKI